MDTPSISVLYLDSNSKFYVVLFSSSKDTSFFFPLQAFKDVIIFKCVLVFFFIAWQESWHLFKTFTKNNNWKTANLTTENFAPRNVEIDFKYGIIHSASENVWPDAQMHKLLDISFIYIRGDIEKFKIWCYHLNIEIWCLEIFSNIRLEEEWRPRLTCRALYCLFKDLWVYTVIIFAIIIKVTNLIKLRKIVTVILFLIKKK